MQNVQVLRIEAAQLINQLPAEALQQAVDYLSSLDKKFTNFYSNGHTEYVTEPAAEHVVDEAQEQLSDNILELRRRLIDDYGDGPVPGDTLFIRDVTLEQYYALSDEEQGQLWDEESKIDLVEYEEIEVPPNVVPV